MVRPAPRIRRSTLAFTNLPKLVGLVIAINEMLVRRTARESVIAYCALTLLGAQVVEDVAMRFIDRLFVKAEEEAG